MSVKPKFNDNEWMLKISIKDVVLVERGCLCRC